MISHVVRAPSRRRIVSPTCAPAARVKGPVPSFFERHHGRTIDASTPAFGNVTNTGTLSPHAHSSTTASAATNRMRRMMPHLIKPPSMRPIIALALLASSSCVIVASHPCNNGVRDGTETDIDCGGSTCPTCTNGLLCAADADCASTYCGTGAICAPPPPSGLPSTVGSQTYIVDNGAAIVINPGTQAGYGITASSGGSFRIVWTGDRGTSGTYRQFTGSVFTTGQIDSFTPGCLNNACPLENDDIVTMPITVAGGDRIDFDCTATTGIDGFDFTITQEPAYFQLFIDGIPSPQLVLFSSSGQESSSATNVFGLTVQ